MTIVGPEEVRKIYRMTNGPSPSGVVLAPRHLSYIFQLAPTLVDWPTGSPRTNNPRLRILDLDQNNGAFLPPSSPSFRHTFDSGDHRKLSLRYICLHEPPYHLYLVRTLGKRDMKIINLQSRDILFAEYRDSGIIWDNIGLKGRTADWARENMVNCSSNNITEI